MKGGELLTVGRTRRSRLLPFPYIALVISLITVKGMRNVELLSGINTTEA